MSKPMKAPLLTADIITPKGGAAPVGATVTPLPTPPVPPAPAASDKPQEPQVPLSFRVDKSFKRAFDRAAFDEEMKGVKFVQKIFRFYQEHKDKV